MCYLSSSKESSFIYESLPLILETDLSIREQISLDIVSISKQIQAVSDVYAKKCHINRDDDWYILKLQEELGELTQQHLKLSKRGRLNGSDEHHKEKLAEELADVFAHLLLYANHNDIDLNEAVYKKWLQWLQ